MRRIETPHAFIALLFSIFMACSAGYAQPSAKELIQHIADNEQKLHNLKVDGQMWEEQQTAQGAWEKTPVTIHAILWSDGRPGGKARLDILKEVNRWIGGAADFAEDSSQLAYDGKVGVYLHLRTGSLGKAFAIRRAQIEPKRPAMLHGSTRAAGTLFSNALYNRDGTGISLSQEMAAQVALAKQVKGGYVTVEAAELQGSKTIKLTVGKKGLVEWSWWVDPARGYSLLDWRVTRQVAKRQIDEESRIIKLAEAAHDVWYPQEAYADFSPPKNEPKRRYHYLAANITANDPHFDPAVFTLKIPKGFVVEDLTKPAPKQPAAQVDPKQLRVQSVANLRQVVQSAKMYADQHEGQGPKSLDVLKKAGLIDEALACPVPHHQYVYVGYEKKMNPLAVVAYEKSEDAGDPVSIAFAGGAVHQFPPADAERIIANGESDAGDWK